MEAIKNAPSVHKAATALGAHHTVLNNYIGRLRLIDPLDRCILTVRKIHGIASKRLRRIVEEAGFNYDEPAAGRMKRGTELLNSLTIRQIHEIVHTLDDKNNPIGDSVIALHLAVGGGVRILKKKLLIKFGISLEEFKSYPLTKVERLYDSRKEKRNETDEGE